MPNAAARSALADPWLHAARVRTHPDALSVLMDSQDATRRLMRRFDSIAATRPPGLQALRGRLSQRLCLEIVVQLQVEEELLFPRLRDAHDDPAAIDLVLAEHRRLGRWVARLLDRDLDGPDGDQRVRTLGQLFARHLRREVLDLVALDPESDQGWEELGQRLHHRRNDLLAAAPRVQVRPTRREQRSTRSEAVTA